jgi:DNA-binding response OmpR family regulator
MPAHVVIVGLNEITTEKLASHLAVNGYDVHQGENGDHALGLIRRFHPDVVMVRAPIRLRDGRTLFDTVRGDPELRSTGVIRVMERNEPGLVVSSSVTGREAHLDPPVDPDTLTRTIQDMLSGGR